MHTIIVIPARFGSTRLLGKPLALLNGKSLIYRTWSIAKTIKHVDEVLIATDDERIREHATDFGARVVMTPADCRNGTERAFAAANTLSPRPEIILNLQGDAVLTPPWAIQTLLDAMRKDPSIGLATTATQMNLEQYQQMLAAKSNHAVGGTTVVFDKNHNALYFSKRMIPFLRETKAVSLPLFRHIGLYIYRYDVLKQYLSLAPSPLEITEGLEQLRALENGIPIKIVLVDYKGRTHWAIDSQEDIEIAQSIIQKEGELLEDLWK
jgi:3-deoxy-manno-octulosonate cytidylyltransferase (CMP-KDO synthetase)